MTEKENFVSEVERRIDNRNADITKFRIIAEIAAPDDQIKFYQIIEEIVHKENAVKDKLAELEVSEADDLTDLKDELGSLQQDVEEAIEAARLEVN